MRRISAVILLVLSANLRAAVVDVGPERGRPLPAINWTDETGRIRNLSELSGYPLILLPIYTRCPGACIQNVDHLKAVLTNSSHDLRQFRVLLFSFDATDTPRSLGKYRQQQNIPLAWSIGCAAQNSIDALLDTIGVQVGKAGTEFTHPNVILFLDPKLRIAKWIYGTDYANADVDLALSIANGGTDWIGQHAQLIYSLLVLGASLLATALAYYILRLNETPRARSPISRSRAA